MKIKFLRNYNLKLYTDNSTHDFGKSILENCLLKNATIHTALRFATF